MRENKNDLESQSFINRFGDSYDEFIQVLIKEFTLTREETGKCLKFEIDNNTMSIRDSHAKRQLNTFLNNSNTGKANQFIKKLKNFDRDKNMLSYRFDSSQSPLRYANGGVLPIIKIDKRDYFCLFYRAVFPVGWNIANGAANNIDDIRNPVRIIHREFSEEFIIADHENETLYIFDVDDEYTMSGTQEMALKLLNEKLKMYDLSKYDRKSIPLKWIVGDDKLKLNYGNEHHSHEGFFVNITPEDNAIEIDKIALINLIGKFSFYDGEVDFNKDKDGSSECFVLDRLIGFFPVDQFLKNLRNNWFEPEFFYYSGKRKNGKEFKSTLKEYFKRHFESGFRTEKQHEKYLEAVKNKMDMNLCPITRAVSEKFNGWLKAEKESIRIKSKSTQKKDKRKEKGKDFEIFISFKSKDQTIADLLYDFLKNEGYNIFCSSKSIKLLGTSEYSKAIDNALEQSKCLILIGSDLESFESGWVDYEWRTFQMLLLSNAKKGELFTLTQNIDPHDLPLGLRSRENIQIINNSLELSFNNLLGYIKNAMGRFG